MLRRRRKLRLTEFIEPVVQSFMMEGDESYSHEVIIPFKGGTSLSWPKVAAPKVTNGTRQYATGSEWIYVKVYLAPSLADQILTESFLPFLTHLLGQAAIKKWFFVRYNDPGYHLRIRIFAGDDKNRVFEILRLFCDQLHVLLKASKIEKFVIDTYERELERYALIEYHLTETLFYYDSLSVCQLLSLSNKGAIPKWQIAIRSIDFILNSLGYNLQQKRAFVQAVHGSFHVEFQSQQPLIYQMDKSYRSHISQVQFTLSNDPENLLIHQIGDCLQPSLDHYRHISGRLQDAPGAEPYIASVVHMFLNRLFSDNHRKLEFLVYHYLKKYYDSIYFKLKTVTIL